jgi:hypothetical protein
MGIIGGKAKPRRSNVVLQHEQIEVYHSYSS